MVVKAVNNHQVLSVSLAVALILAVFRAPAADAAEGAGETGRASFSVHDINRDGYISRAEFEEFRRELKARAGRGRRHFRGFPGPLAFDQIDTDGDGWITEDEMISALKHRRRHRRRQRGGSEVQ